MEILKGIRVIELASVLAGPSVGQFLAECGAEVIKIENPTTAGDVTRTWKLPQEPLEDDISAYFASVNWGKKSICIDIASPQNRSYLYTLIAKADIVIASYKAGDAQKLGVDYATLRQFCPHLIYGHITGYGNEDSRVGYDAIIQAEAGFIYMNGEPDSIPTKMPVALVDILAAHQLKEGILLALLRRERTGEGSCVSVSLFDAAVASLANQATNWLCAGHIPQRMGSQHPNIVPYGSIFTTADAQKILIAVGNDKQFVELCKILMIQSLATDERFKTNPLRVKNRESLIPILQDAFLRFEQKTLLLAFQKAQIPAGSINPMPQVFELANAQKLVLHGKNKKGVRNFVAHFEGITPIEMSEPPHLGQDNPQ